MIKKFTPTLNKLACQGFTLVELLVTIGVVAIVTSIAMPNLNTFLVKMKVDNEISELQRALLSARNHAINSGTITTACPLDNNNICTNTWHSDITVFTEEGGVLNTYEPDDEQIIRVKNTVNNSDTVVFNPVSISYGPDGTLSTPANSGTMTYCPNADSSLARALFIAQSGRVFTSQEVNGIEVNRNGTPVACP